MSICQFCPENIPILTGSSLSQSLCQNISEYRCLKSKEKAAEKKASKEVNKVVEESKPEEAKCEPEEVDENETEN